MEDDWKQFLKATWDALVVNDRWANIFRMVVDNVGAPNARYSRRELDYSYAWCHRRKKNHGSVGVYLEPTHFDQLDDGGHVGRVGAAVDIAVRLQTPGPASSYADAFLELLHQIDPGLNVRRAVYPNPTAGEHPNDTVVVCAPPEGAVPAIHRNWDPAGLWIGLRCHMDGLEDRGLGRVADVVQSFSANIDRFQQVVKLALAYLAAGPVRPFSFEALLGWCGEYVVDETFARSNGLVWDGGYSVCDFTRPNPGFGCVEVKTTTTASLHLPRFSLREIRYALGQANGYRVARVSIDAATVVNLHKVLCGMTPAIPANNTPTWSKKLAGVIGYFVPHDDQVRKLLRAIVEGSTINWYDNPFLECGEAPLATALGSGDAAFGEGNVEVILRPKFATKFPVLQS